MYVLDEPSIGLHQRDNARLLATLRQLRDLATRSIVIEHNLDVIKTADWIVDLRPGRRRGGGTIVAQGTPEQVAKSPPATPAGSSNRCYSVSREETSAGRVFSATQLNDSQRWFGYCLRRG